MHMNTMVSILAWTVVLGLVQVVLTVLAVIGQRGLSWAAHARDDSAPLPGVGGRLQRALANFLETFPLFAAVALAAMVMGHADAGQALLGAQLYFWGRVAYVPAYAAGIPWLRTLIWAVSLVGLVMLLLTLF